MKRLFAIATVALAPVLFATSCDWARSDIVATVGGHDVTVAQMESLAGTKYVASEAAQATGLVSRTPGTTGSAKYRFALGLLVQREVLDAGLRSRHKQVTDADRASATQELQSAEQQNGSKLEPRISSLFLNLYADRYALLRLLKLHGASDAATPEKVAAYFEQNRANYPTGVVTCVAAFFVPEENAATVKAALDQGAREEAVLQEPSLKAQSLVQGGGERCLPPGTAGPPELVTLVDESAVGAWASATIDDPQAGKVEVFAKPSSRGEVTADTPSVNALIRQALEQADLEKRFGAEVVRYVNSVDVHIDPRYGTWAPSDPQLVAAPPAPTLSSRDARAQAKAKASLPATTGP